MARNRPEQRMARSECVLSGNRRRVVRWVEGALCGLCGAPVVIDPLRQNLTGAWYSALLAGCGYD